MASSSNEASSRRWTHFHSALQLAIQRAAHKWTFDDFVECFSLWAEESPDGASSVFNTISNFQESQITTDINNLLKEYSVGVNIDTLHTVVNEAVARKARGESGQDVWKDLLEPHAAVCARTVPLLEGETMRLREMLKNLEEENSGLVNQLEDNVRQRKENDEKLATLLANLHQVYEQFKALPMEEIENWTLQTAETTKPVQRG